MCDPHLVYAILEILTLLQRATENEYLDEVSDFISGFMFGDSAFCSMNQLGSTIPTGQTLPYNSRITIKYEMKSLATYGGTQTLGLN